MFDIEMSPQDHYNPGIRHHMPVLPLHILAMCVTFLVRSASERRRNSEHPLRIGHSDRSVTAYCIATRIGINPCPAASGLSALPMTAPNALAASDAFMAWPGMFDVVSRSPTAIGSSS